MADQNQDNCDKPDSESQEGNEAGGINNNTLLKTAGVYVIFGADGKEQERGSAKIIVKEEEISILPESGKVLNVAMREITEAAGVEYVINLCLSGGAGVEISQLGYQYEDFWRAFWEARNAILINDLLMGEPGDLGKAKAQVVYSQNNLGICDIQFYETSLLVMPKNAEIFKINYGDIDEMKTVDFKIILAVDGQTIELGQMGQSLDNCAKIINNAIIKISTETQSQIKEIIPGLESLAVRQIADLMRDGRCAAKPKVDALASGAWPKFEKFLETAGIKESYSYLKTLSGADAEIYIGIKRTMMGGLAGNYVWFLIPLQNYNAVAMEATGKGASGRATYFFRLTDRQNFAADKKIDSIQAGEIVNAVQKCVKRINFRREPIYLPEEKLSEPRYWKYKFILGKIPELQFLRRTFIGRVCHRSDEQWQKETRELLEFNISQKNDAAKWSASDDNLEPDVEPVPGEDKIQNENEPQN